MKIETKYNNGDVVYGVQKKYPRDSWLVIGPMTIGQVRVEITDSPGLDRESIMHNYSAQKGRKEQYMCVETGIGSGTVYDFDGLFRSKSEATKIASELNGK